MLLENWVVPILLAVSGIYVCILLWRKDMLLFAQENKNQHHFCRNFTPQVPGWCVLIFTR